MSRNRSSIRFAFLGMLLVAIMGAIALGLNFEIFPVNANSGPTDLPATPSVVNGRIAFSSNRTGVSKIYTMNADGTNVTCLMCTVSSDDGNTPAFSPDGMTIAFRRAGSIWLMDADGTNPRSLNSIGTDPAWSPDGTRIAFMRTASAANDEIFVMNADGSGQTNITNTAGNDVTPSWSVATPDFPQGRIAFMSQRTLNSEIFVIAPTSLSMAFQDSSQVNVTNNSVSDFQPEWSPDGLKLAYASTRDNSSANEMYTMMMNPSPGTVARLTSDSFNDTGSSWSPDGSKIVHTSSQANTEIVVTDAVPGIPLVAGLNISNNSATDSAPSWGPVPGSTSSRVIRAVDITGSPGQQVIVSFELNSLGDEAATSFTVNFDVTKLSNPLVTLGSGAPAGADVGTNLSQALSGRVGVLLDSTTPFTAGNRQMFTLRFNVAANAAAGPTAITFGGSPTIQSVTDTLGGSLPTTYQSGNVNITSGTITNGKVIYQRGGRDTADIYSITPGTGLSIGLRKGYHPAHSPDGTKIAFVDNTPGGTFGFLFLMNSDGTNVREFATPRRGFTPTWSPDGSRLAYVRGDFNSVGDNGKGEIFIADMTPGSEGANEVLIPTGTRQISKPSWGSTNRIVAACYDPFPGGGTDPKGVCVTGTIPASSEIGSNPPTFTLISGSNTNDRDAAWSPSGSKIAFLSTRDYPMATASEIYTMNPDGTGATRLTTVDNFKVHPAWSPDGTRIAFSRGFTPSANLSSVLADGSNGTSPTIITLSGSGDVFPNWGRQPAATPTPTPTPTPTSGANGKIAFERFTDGAGVVQIYTVADTVGATATVCGGASETREGRRPAFSHDGTRLAFMRANTIWTANADCTNQFSTGAAGDAPTWSPDGTKIAFIRGGSFTDIWTMNTDGTGQTKLTDIATETRPTGSFSNTQPSWGSNNKIVFRATSRKIVNGSLASVGDIWTMDPNGTSFLRLTDDPVHAYAPDWSPDNSKIVFVSNRATNRGEIYMMDAAGTNQTRITTTPFLSNSNPAWSPDGSKIVHDDDSSNITSRDANGGNSTVLALGNFPDWSPAPPAADVRITNIANTPNPGAINQNLFFRINLVNNGPATATGITVTTDPLPTWTFFQPGPSSAGCTMNADRTVTCNLAGSLAGSGLGTSSFIDIAMTATQPGSIAFRARVSAAQTDPVPANNEATATTVVQGTADLALDITGPNQTTAFSDVVYNMNVRNNGPTSALGVSAAFNIPTGVDFVLAEPSIFNCTPAAITGGTRITCSISQIEANATLIPRITIRPRSAGTILIGGDVSANGSVDPVSNNNVDSQNVTVNEVPSADLSVAVEYSPNIINNTVRVGQEYSVFFTVRNLGPATATTAILIFTTAQGVENVAGSTDSRCDTTTNGEGQTLFVCSLGNLTNGASVNQLRITLRALAPGLRSDVVSVTANEPDPVTSNNTLTTGGNVNAAQVDLEMIADFPPEIFLGDNATITVRVRNNGPSPASNVRIRIQRFSGTVLASISGSGCTEDANIVSCPLGNLAAGQSSQILTVVFRPNTTGDMRLELLVDSSTQEQFPDPHPNGGIINVPVKPRVELLGLEVTQGVQDLANSIPLIKGKRTYVRAYFKAQGTAEVTPELVGYRNTVDGFVPLGTLPMSNSGMTAILATQDPDRDNLESNAYFFLPETWTTGGSYKYVIRLKGDPGPMTCSEPDGVSNCETIVSMRETPQMPVEIVMLTYRTGGTDFTPDKRLRNLAIQQMEAVLPIRSLQWTESSITLTPDVCPTGNDYNLILNVLSARRTLDCPAGNCTKRYMGLLNPNFGETCASGGVAFQPGFVGTSSVRALSTNGELNPAHEMIHSIGLPHVEYTAGPGADEGSPGPHTPADGTISVAKPDFDRDTVYGFDVYNINQYDISLPTQRQRVFGPDTPDIMSYASARKWVSELHYKRILSFLDGNGGIATVRPEEMDQVETDEIVLVSGLVPQLPTGSALLQPIYRINSPRTISLPTSGTHQIVFEGAQGQTLATHNFTPQLGSDGASAPTAPFSLALPWVAGTTRIALKKDTQVLSSQQASANSPQVTLTSPNGGETLSNSTVQVQWTASDTDSGSSLRYILQFSPDGGSTWKTLVTESAATSYTLDRRNLAGTTNGVMRVFASDGFNTSSDVSNAAFTVSPHGPDVSITAPGNTQLFVADQIINFEGSAIDVEDGLLEGSNLAWTSSLNGALGNGRSLSIAANTLQEGNHTITLTGTDSGGRVGTATATITIARVPPILPPSLSTGVTQMFFTTMTGARSAAQSLSISNGGSGNLTWSAVTDSPWIALGSASGAAPTSVNVTVDATALQPGTYAGKITLTSPGVANSPQIVNISVLVTEQLFSTISGRVLTPTGIGLRNATVTLVSPSGIRRTATTSSFGLFSFANVPNGPGFTISVTSKRYRFSPRIVQVDGNLNLGDLIGLE